MYAVTISQKLNHDLLWSLLLLGGVLLFLQVGRRLVVQQLVDGGLEDTRHGGFTNLSETIISDLVHSAGRPNYYSRAREPEYKTLETNRHAAATERFVAATNQMCWRCLAVRFSPFVCQEIAQKICWATNQIFFQGLKIKKIVGHRDHFPGSHRAVLWGDYTGGQIWKIPQLP
jgi:hypothetical protein